MLFSAWMAAGSTAFAVLELAVLDVLGALAAVVTGAGVGARASAPALPAGVDVDAQPPTAMVSARTIPALITLGNAM